MPSVYLRQLGVRNGLSRHKRSMFKRTASKLEQSVDYEFYGDIANICNLSVIYSAEKKGSKFFETIFASVNKSNSKNIHSHCLQYNTEQQCLHQVRHYISLVYKQCFGTNGTEKQYAQRDREKRKGRKKERKQDMIS